MPDKPEQAEIVRTPLELQRAHDILVNIICNDDLQEEVMGGAPDRAQSMVAIKAAADVLCWALGHEHNENFEHNLKGLELMIKVAGYAMHDAGELIWMEEGDHGPLPS